MRRLIWGFASRIYHIVGNLMSRLIYITETHSDTVKIEPCMTRWFGTNIRCCGSYRHVDADCPHNTDNMDENYCETDVRDEPIHCKKICHLIKGIGFLIWWHFKNSYFEKWMIYWQQKWYIDSINFLGIMTGLKWFILYAKIDIIHWIIF